MTSPPLPNPPPASGITVEPGDAGPRITLPRVYTRVDLVLTAVAAGIAIWMAVWLDAIRYDPGASTLGRAAMAIVGLAFGAIAVSQGFAMAARRVVEDAGDRLVISRQVGVRRVLRRSIPKGEIEKVERMWEKGEDVRDVPGSVWIHTERQTHRCGKGLDEDSVEWLEATVRGMVGR